MTCINFANIATQQAREDAVQARKETSKKLEELLQLKKELAQSQQDLDQAIQCAKAAKEAQSWRLMVQMRMEYAQHSLKGRINKKSAELTGMQMLKVQQKFDQLLGMSKQPIVPKSFLDQFDEFELFVIELL
jgi:hypothetical protein